MTREAPARWVPLLAAGVLSAAVLVLFATSPKHEDFWWTDAATFALNGELVRDYLASGFPHSPIAFANEWFVRYPALTISFYPPIFPMAEALVFAVFGFSHPAAQATVAAFTALAACGVYLTVRTAAPPLVAAAAALLFFATPDVLLWSRQVMMELPALAFLLVASAALLRYQASGATPLLFLTAALFVAAVYTKQPTVFAAPAFAAALLLQPGPSLLRRRSVWLAVAAVVVGLLPLAAFTVLYAPWLIDAAVGAGTASVRGDATASHISVIAFIVYARALPEIVGLPLLTGALGYFALLAIRGWPRDTERQLVVLMLAWFSADYLFLSVTGHFEARYGIALTVPPAILSVLLVKRLAGPRWQSAAALASGIMLFGASIVTHDVHRIAGYDAVAAFVLDHSKQDSVALFQGKESKNFVFSLRSHAKMPKVYVIRAEKLLVRYNILREWGITDLDVSDTDIAAMIDRYGVSTVVLQPDFWTDQPSMARLQAFVYSDRFRQVAEFPITSEEPSQRTTIKVFENLRPTQPTDRAIPRGRPAPTVGGPGNQGGGVSG
ncbi:MAG: 4-amino-4-deoxy-L-arabinose transferase [Rhodospirillales bacterium]|jgi:hypothetical protein|nr:4-amino-4-deoxy-L-arabinose transferase [Rhodospirillales bacterium]